MTLIHRNLVEVFCDLCATNAQYQMTWALSSTLCLLPQYSTSVKADDCRDCRSPIHTHLPMTFVWSLFVDIGHSKEVPDWFNIIGWLSGCA